MNCYLDEVVDEREEEPTNPEEDAAGEQWFYRIKYFFFVFNLVFIFIYVCIFILSSKIKYKHIYSIFTLIYLSIVYLFLIIQQHFFYKCDIDFN
jgi:hypothetical protein